MILHKIMDAKAPCGTHRSGAVKVFSFSDFDFAEPFGSAFFLPRGCAVSSVTLERSDRVQSSLTQEFN
jgi:hypothetical protein